MFDFDGNLQRHTKKLSVVITVISVVDAAFILASVFVNRNDAFIQKENKYNTIRSSSLRKGIPKAA